MKSALWPVVASLWLAAQAAAESPSTSPDRLPSALRELDRLANETLAKTGVPGIAICVVHQDRVVFLKGYGVREAGKEARVDGDTLFQLASVSKPIASTVLASLVGEGKVGWDDRVIDRDAAFRLSDPLVSHDLRLRDLLCHRSGLPDHAGDLLEDMGYDRTEILHRLRFLKLGPFRARFAYTNFGYTEAAMAAAKAVEKSWEELSAERLYRPLGMTSTSSRFVDYEKAVNRALAHVRVGDRWVAKYTRDADAQSPAGGVSSTATDLAQWMRLQLGGGKFEGKQVVAEEALAETHRPQIMIGFDSKAGSLFSYGLGWNVSVERGGRTFWKHSGEFDLGIRTKVALAPEEQVGIAVLSNAAPTAVPEALTESFFDWLLNGKLQRDWFAFGARMMEEQAKKDRAGRTDYSHPPERPLPALPTAVYAGRYRNDYFGEIEVGEVNGGLVLRLGPKKEAHQMTHWTRDDFVYETTGEMASGPSGASFRIGPDGKAAAVLIEALNVHGEGRFARVGGRN